jgi:hypothetical protein
MTRNTSVTASQKEENMYIAQTNKLILNTEIIAAFPVNGTKHIKMLYGQVAEFLNVRTRVKISWTDRVKNEVLHGIKDERSVLHKKK